MTLELLIDDRERAVVPHIAEIESKFNIAFTVKRLEVGDYAIAYRGQILIIIERKTWIDLAASFRDGRKANVFKLLNLRDATACKIFYLIEGDPCPNQNKIFSNIPVKNMQAHLDHLTIRDDIHITYSRNIKETAYRLFQLAVNISTIKPSICSEIDNKLNCIDAKAEYEGGNVHKLTEKQKNIINVQELLLQKIPNIGSIVATVLSEQNIGLIDLYNGTCTEADIARYKYPGGKTIGLIKAAKICKGVQCIGKKTAAAHKIHTRILEAIPLIGKKTVVDILETFDFKDLIDGKVPLEVLQNMKKGRNKLGHAKAESIIYALRKDATIQDDTKNNALGDDNKDNKDEEPTLIVKGNSKGNSKVKDNTLTRIVHDTEDNEADIYIVSDYAECNDIFIG